mmetsp:Transcript_271/g.676  ORF Transcript_271/g.676 Transcript_271/m.676 type:complete len:718 (+) Transcript_271:230-2383(+)
MSASPVWEQGGAPAARRRKTGTLLKWVNYVSGWQKRYFELQNGLLSYYRSADEVGAGCRGSMLAREIAIDHRGREMILSAGNATFYLRATSEKELMRWITALELEKQQIPVDGGRAGGHTSISSILSDKRGGAASPASASSSPGWGVTIKKRSRLPRRDSFGNTSFGSMASTFSDASDFSEPSYAPGEQSEAVLRSLGGLAGVVTAQERGIRKLNVTGEAFADACTRYESLLNSTLVGPEPDIEARQEEYIDNVRDSHRKVCEMLSKIIVGAIDHHKELLKAASYSQGQVDSAEKRVEEMEVDVDKVRRVLVPKRPARLTLEGSTSSYDTVVAARQSQDTVVASDARGSLDVAHAAAAAAAAEPHTPERSGRPSWSDDPKPLDSPNTRQTKRFEALTAVLTPSRLPNRPHSTRHRRSSSDPSFSTSGPGDGTAAATAETSVSVIDAKLAAQEKAPVSAAELTTWETVARRIGMGAVDLGLLTQRDRTQVVRGYAAADDPIKETVEGAKRIALWRESIVFETLVKRHIPEAEEFHKLWRETVYGEDCFGHPLIGIKVAQIDVSALNKFPNSLVELMVAQRLAVYRDYLEFISASRREQRYKMSFLIDMSGAGVSSLLGENKALMQKIFGVGTKFFPETVWKIYVVNAPFALRVGWAIVSKLIHPVTEAKIAILGSHKDAQARMIRDGFALDAIPTDTGGSNRGLLCWDLLQQLQKNAK